MNILIITQWYPPEPMTIFGELAETLHGLGHEVTVLTGFPNWPTGRIYPGYRQKLWDKQELNGVRIIRVALFPDHSRSAFRRALNFISFGVATTVLAPFICPRSDVIHLIQPPVTAGVAALLLSALWRVPFTIEIQDMWPENLKATGMIEQKAVLALVGRLAQLIYSRASAVRVISQGFRTNLLQKGVSASKICVISNWVDTEHYRPVKPDRELAKILSFEGRFTVMYAGTIGLAQGLEVVLEAAALLRDLPPIQFVLVGDGVEFERLQTLITERQLVNVRLLGRRPAEDMPALYAIADVLLVHLRNDPLYRVTIPHKVFAYLASGKPVLAAMDGDVAELIEPIGCGLTCPPSDPEALATTVRTFFGMSGQARAEMGAKGRSAVCDSYNRVRLVTRIAELLDDVIACRERPSQERSQHDFVR